MQDLINRETPTTIELADTLRRIVIDVLKLDPTATVINDETNLYELGLESLNVVELLTQLEMTFDITIDVDDLSAELFGRFGTLVEFSQRKLSGAD
ncbi:MAG: acyl carrier protein [Rubrivivax sp.]|nr:acyl carrier protein [Rubrivivax sp.]